MKAKNKYSYNSIGNSVHIFVNGILHIGFKLSDFKGFQAWKFGREKGCYKIELHFVSDGKDWSMELEYDNQEKAKEINVILTKFI